MGFTLILKIDIEKVKTILFSKYFKTFLLSFLVLANVWLAGVDIEFSFVMVVVVLSYLAAAGIFFRKADPSSRFHKAVMVYVFFEKLISWLFVATLVIALVAQIYFKIIY